MVRGQRHSNHRESELSNVSDFEPRQTFIYIVQDLQWFEVGDTRMSVFAFSKQKYSLVRGRRHSNVSFRIFETEVCVGSRSETLECQLSHFRDRSIPWFEVGDTRTSIFTFSKQKYSMVRGRRHSNVSIFYLSIFIINHEERSRSLAIHCKAIKTRTTCNASPRSRELWQQSWPARIQNGRQ